MAQITLRSDRAKRTLSIVGVLFMLVTAGAAIYVGLQLDRNQAPTNSSADSGCDEFSEDGITLQVGACGTNGCGLDSNYVKVCSCEDLNNNGIPDDACGYTAAFCKVNTVCQNTCVGFTCDASAWGACINGTQTCNSPVMTPVGCTAGTVSPTRPCTVTSSTSNACTAYTCTQWGACSGGSQTCLTVSFTPTGCTGGVQPPSPYTQSCSTPTSSGGGGSTQTSTTTTDTSCDAPTGRPNGCKCNRNDKCISNYCDPSSNTCERPPECQNDSRPNGCQCSNPAKCASGNCVNGFCRPVGGGTLPSTGLFDDNGGVLIVGLGLLTLGMFALLTGRGRKPKVYVSVQPAQPQHPERNPGFESAFLESHAEPESTGSNDFETEVLRGKKR